MLPLSPELLSAVRAVLGRRMRLAPERPLVVGVSGIDASGKSRFARLLVETLRAGGVDAVGLSVDDHLRAEVTTPGLDVSPETFFAKAIRFEDVLEAIAARPEPVVVAEGIFLFRREWRETFDLRLWLECSFETALERAVRRRQEGLDGPATRAEYERLYFPAQRLHFERDDPTAATHLILPNDEGQPDPGRLGLTTSARPAVAGTVHRPTVPA